MKKCKNILFVKFYLGYLLSLESEIKSIKSNNISSLRQKNPNENILCLLCSTYCPVLEVKVRINVLVPSDVINRSKSIDFTKNASEFLFFQKIIRDSMI